MKPIEPLTSLESPRDILLADFKSLPRNLGISGGWGYTQADACVIEESDRKAGIALEYVFVEKRIYEEMIVFRPAGDKFSGIQWHLLRQQLFSIDGRSYDKLVFEISALPDSDWEALKTEWEGPNGCRNPAFDQEAHDRKRAEKTVRVTRDFWFDITHFHRSSR